MPLFSSVRISLLSATESIFSRISKNSILLRLLSLSVGQRGAKPCTLEVFSSARPVYYLSLSIVSITSNKSEVLDSALIVDRR